jgi:hypothetical protein
MEHSTIPANAAGAHSQHLRTDVHATAGGAASEYERRRLEALTWLAEVALTTPRLPYTMWSRKWTALELTGAYGEILKHHPAIHGSVWQKSLADCFER